MYMRRGRELVTKKCSKVGIRVNRLAVPESGERKRNLTTTGLGEKQRKSETRPVPTKSSQSPLRIRSVQVEGVKELGSDKVTSHEVPMAPGRSTARRWQTNVVRDLENEAVLLGSSPGRSALQSAE